MKPIVDNPVLQPEFPLADSRSNFARSGQFIGWGEVQFDGKIYIGKIVSIEIGGVPYFHVETILPSSDQTGLVILPNIAGKNIITLFPEEQLRARLDVQKIPIPAIQGAVCRQFHLCMEQLLSKNRPTEIVIPRMIAMRVAHETGFYSLQEIGAAFPYSRDKIRDHGTVSHACKQIVKLARKDHFIFAALNLIRAEFNLPVDPSEPVITRNASRFCDCGKPATNRCGDGWECQDCKAKRIFNRAPEYKTPDQIIKTEPKPDLSTVQGRYASFRSSLNIVKPVFH